MCLLSAHKNGTFGSPQKVLDPFFTALAKNERKIAEDILKYIRLKEIINQLNFNQYFVKFE